MSCPRRARRRRSRQARRRYGRRARITFGTLLGVSSAVLDGWRSIRLASPAAFLHGEEACRALDRWHRAGPR